MPNSDEVPNRPPQPVDEDTTDPECVDSGMYSNQSRKLVKGGTTVAKPLKILILALTPEDRMNGL